LLEKGRQLQVSLRTKAVSDAQLAALLNDYQAAVEEDRERHLKAQTTLQKLVELPKMPRVETLLTLLGVYGDGPVVVGGMMGFGLNQRANPAPPAQAAPAVAPPPPVAPPPATEKLQEE
jgi:hypothetical protein